MTLTDYVGIPWKDLGRDYAGTDCYGIVFLAYRDLLKIDLPSYSDAYLSAADAIAVSRLIDGGKSEWLPVEVGRERPLDAVLMTEKYVPRHIGLVYHPGKVLHMRTGFDSVVEDYRTSKFDRRVVGFFRHEDAR